MRWIDLSIGGWDGWEFGPYGRAKEWRLIAPEATDYTRGEIDWMRRHMGNYDWLTDRVRHLEEKLNRNPLRVTDDELRVLYRAVIILDRALETCGPIKNRRRLGRVEDNERLAALVDVHRSIRAGRKRGG